MLSWSRAKKTELWPIISGPTVVPQLCIWHMTLLHSVYQLYSAYWAYSNCSLKLFVKFPPEPLICEQLKASLNKFQLYPTVTHDGQFKHCHIDNTGSWVRMTQKHFKLGPLSGLNHRQPHLERIYRAPRQPCTGVSIWLVYVLESLWQRESPGVECRHDPHRYTAHP